MEKGFSPEKLISDLIKHECNVLPALTFSILLKMVPLSLEALQIIQFNTTVPSQKF